MLRLASNILRRRSPRTLASSLDFSLQLLLQHTCPQSQQRCCFGGQSKASSPSLSIWRRKKEMGKEGLIVAKELKRLHSHPLRLDRFIHSHVSRLLKSDLLAVLAEFQRQDLVFLSMKVCFLSLLLLFFWILFVVSEELCFFFGSYIKLWTKQSKNEHFPLRLLDQNSECVTILDLWFSQPRIAGGYKTSFTVIHLNMCQIYSWKWAVSLGIPIPLTKK